ncbi:MAG: hypothetical protein Tsb002_29600 [Wenzhouxiangellaceae bacterium]
MVSGLLLLLVLHWPAFSGSFTSDSFSILANCARQHDSGQLWQWISHNFWHGLDVRSHYYRPLSSASLCLDYWLFGPSPLALHLLQLCLHAVNGWLLYRLGCALATGERYSHRAAACAALLFWASPASPEVSIWLAGRYDVLALLFMLLALLAQVRQRPYSSALMLALALSSKEAAMILPPMLAAVSWWRYAIENGPRPRLSERLPQAWQELWPAAVVMVAYLILRQALFGNPFTVYPDSHGAIADIGWHWLQRLGMLADTLLPTWRGQPSLSLLFWGALGGALIASGWHAQRTGHWLRAWAVPMLWTIVAVVALLPHLQQLSSAGQGSRLLYTAGAWTALMLCLPWARQTSHQRSGLLRLAAAMALLVVWLIAQYPAQRDWNRATHFNRQLLTELHDLAQQRPAGQWVLVLVPDHLGSALVARNAQGALASPPFQPQPLLDRVIPLLAKDIGLWHQRLQQGVDWSQLRPPVDSSQQNRLPSAFYCSATDNAKLIQLPVPRPGPSAADWRQRWQTAMANTPCASIDTL